MSEFGLDLTGADPDAVGFPAIPSGSYEAHVAKAEWKTTENIDGSKALPHGTRYLNLGIQVNDDVEDRNGQKVAGVYAGFAKLFIPPADHDPTKAQRMKNYFANFLNAIGEDWQKKNYAMPDADALIGKQLTVVVRKKPEKDGYPERNDVEGFKPAGSSQSAETGMLV